MVWRGWFGLFLGDFHFHTFCQPALNGSQILVRSACLLGRCSDAMRHNVHARMRSIGVHVKSISAKRDESAEPIVSTFSQRHHQQRESIDEVLTNISKLG